MARQLIAKASTKLASALQTSISNNLNAARVDQIMLDAVYPKYSHRANS